MDQLGTPTSTTIALLDAMVSRYQCVPAGRDGLLAARLALAHTLRHGSGYRGPSCDVRRHGRQRRSAGCTPTS